MKLINEMVNDLIQYSNDYNRGLTDKQTLNLQLELMKANIKKLEIDFTKHPLDNIEKHTKNVFRQLLVRHKNKAINYINLLIQTEDKRRYNKLARHLIDNKLFFIPFCLCLKRNISGYKKRNNLTTVKEFQILIIGGSEDE